MTPSLVAILLLYAVGTICADELPIIGLIREVIYETDQDLAKNHQDHLQLPDLGTLSLDPIKLRNGSLGVLSTMELVGDQNAEENDKPDGSMDLILDLSVGLGTLSLQYDFQIKVLGLYERTGVAELKTSNDVARANVTVSLSKEGKCSATLNSVRITKLQDFEIVVEPDDLPFLTLIKQALLNFLVPKTLPLVNLAIKNAVETDIVQKKFSETLCGKLPL